MAGEAQALATVLASIITGGVSTAALLNLRFKDQREREEKVRTEEAAAREREVSAERDRLERTQAAEKAAAERREADLLAQERSRADSVRERLHVARVSTDLHCHFYGPMDDAYVADIRLHIENEGLALRRYHRTIFNLRGIKDEHGLRYRVRADRPDDRSLSFPLEISRQEVGAEWIIEPGTRQIFTYRTRIDADVRFLLVRVTLSAEDGLGSWEERVFPVRPASGRSEPSPAERPQLETVGRVS